MSDPIDSRMIRRSVRGCGSLYTLDFLMDGPGIRVSRDFLKRLSYQFAALSSRFFDATEDLPYAYRERQLSASVLSSMSTFVDAVFAESPTRRGTAKENSHGWIDYWAVFRKVTLIVELKHCYSAVNPQKDIQAKVSACWNSAHKQLGAVKKSYCEDLRFGTGEMVKVPLLIVTHYVSSQDAAKARVPISDADVCARHKTLASKLFPLPSWSAVWIPKPAMRAPFPYKNAWEAYPAVSLFSDVDVVCKPRE